MFKEAYGPQQSRLLIQIWQNNCSQNKKNEKCIRKIFTLYILKIEKEKVVLKTNVFCEMFLKFNFTWKYTKEFILRLSGWVHAELKSVLG